MNDAQHSLTPKQQREKQRALTLSALTQVSCLVETIAQEGKHEAQHFNCCMDALLHESYMQGCSFMAGAIKAKRLLQGQDIPHAKRIMGHTAALIAIEKKLAKQPDKLAAIATGMQRIQKQIEYFNDPYHGNIISAIAHLYGETISDIHPRIIIRGKPEYLKQSQNTERIRCLLFSGIRAAWVWRTNGGNAFHLLLGRRKIIQQLEILRKSS